MLSVTSLRARERRATYLTVASSHAWKVASTVLNAHPACDPASKACFVQLLGEQETASHVSIVEFLD